MKIENGQRVRVTTPAQWAEQKHWIRGQIQPWVFGRTPPAPDNLRVASTEERREGNITVRDVRLEFGPGHRAKLNLTLMIPDGSGPKPVFLTNHLRGNSTSYMRVWVHTAVSRGIAAISGFSPLRLDTPEKGTEGVRHYSHLHGLLPKLGFFLGHEERLPIDYDELLALAAPKQVLIVAPEFDRYAPVGDVRQEVVAAQTVYRALGREGDLELRTPRDFNRLSRTFAGGRI